ncbi:hypothetical protein A6E10_01090 [Aliivibrio fischeri]|nr:hypothetical protein A6E10_01090 [Aliivibrio fischeri]
MVNNGAKCCLLPVIPICISVLQNHLCISLWGKTALAIAASLEVDINELQLSLNSQLTNEKKYYKTLSGVAKFTMPLHIKKWRYME